MLDELEETNRTLSKVNKASNEEISRLQQTISVRYTNIHVVNGFNNDRYFQMFSLEQKRSADRIEELEGHLKLEIERNSVLQRFQQLSETLSKEGVALLRDIECLKLEN